MSIKENVKKFLKLCGIEKWVYLLVYMIKSIPYYLFRICPIKNNKIVFVSFRGKYGGDPKYVSDKMYVHDSSVDIVWLLRDSQECQDSHVRRVKYDSLEAIYELVTAKVWVDDCRKSGEVRKRKGQFYIGTGHGGIPMKKIEKDAEDKLPVSYLLWAQNDSKMTDLKPSNSQWRNDMLRRAFWYDGEILNCGLPRVEHLIKNRDKIKQLVRVKYGINENERLYLYAPTFRNSNDINIYDLDFVRVGKALNKRFGDGWIGMRRLHPNCNNVEKMDIPGIVIDMTDYPDMEELMMACDLLITDYSSCIFETFFLDIPAFIYATDIKEYTEKERGLYWDINTFPFLKATTNEELIEGVLNYNSEIYAEELNELKKEIGLFDDQTHATEILVNRILEEMKK